MSDCRKRHCEYCGMTPCVEMTMTGRICPQWDEHWEDVLGGLDDLEEDGSADPWDDDPFGEGWS